LALPFEVIKGVFFHGRHLEYGKYKQHAEMNTRNLQLCSESGAIGAIEHFGYMQWNYQHGNFPHKKYTVAPRNIAGFEDLETLGVKNYKHAIRPSIFQPIHEDLM
jgi:hypothetical protein